MNFGPDIRSYPYCLFAAVKIIPEGFRNFRQFEFGFVLAKALKFRLNLLHLGAEDWLALKYSPGGRLESGWPSVRLHPQPDS